jgi:hypothetical protein
VHTMAERYRRLCAVWDNVRLASPISKEVLS